MTMLLQLAPSDQPVYLFLDRNRAESKPFYVYMTAGANKFLRIYFGKVRDYLAELGEPGHDTASAKLFKVPTSYRLPGICQACTLLLVLRNRP